jgi:hypothetical protein
MNTPTRPRIVQLCTPTAGTIIALDDTGGMWERDLDPRQFAGPNGRKSYRWTRIDDPFVAAISEEQKRIADAKALLKMHGEGA